MRTTMAEPGRGGPSASRGQSVADEPPARPAPGPGSPLALRNWRVRTRLISLIAIPTLVAVILGALRVTSSIGSAEQYGHVSTVGAFVTRLGELARDIALERDLSAWYVAATRSAEEETRLATQREIVDAAISRTATAATAAEDSLSDLGRRKLAVIRTRLTQLPSLRATVTDTELPPLPTVEKYSEVIAEMLQLYDEVGQGSADEDLISTTAALRAVARAEEETSKLRGLLSIALVTDAFEEPEYQAFLDARSKRESERAAFRAVATLAQRQFHDNTVASVRVGRAEFYMDRAVFLTNAGQSLARIDPSTPDDTGRWFDSISDTVDGLHTVQKSLLEQVITRSADVQSSDRSVAAVKIALVLALLVLVLLVTAVMARSLVRPLRLLRGDALKVAGHSLPELVRRLRNSELSPEEIRTPPIGVSSKDEIGEVARAFDEVHREAVRLAGEEARLRSNVNAMFVNLSRRSQTLVERQITLIDSLEQGEQDEQRLANLFKLDHLATRMRRNSENLLVLAGQEPPRRWSKPVQLVDVARASLSEVESYERVALQVPDGVSVAGQAVNDVIHLLAELVENALAFSPRESRVILSGSRIDGGGAMLSITDAGIGMTPEELAQANERLTGTPVVDVSVSRRMGLFVVARLARRHGIRVQLRRHSSGGLTAMVLLPESLLGTAPAAGHPAPSPPQWQAGRDEPGPSYQPGQARHPYPPSVASYLGEPVWTGAQQRRPAYGSVDTGDVWTVERSPTRNGPVDVGPIRAAQPATTGDEYLPIFASVESAWFERGGAPTGTWGSARADAGWSAARVAVEPVRDGATAAGLPKRVPKANLVPGSAEPAPTVPPPTPPLSPDRVRSRLASYQQGFRAARDDISMGRAPAPGVADGGQYA
ncbi:MAG TPA: nitrate- and nitrite sensing domain-containing protein [Nonomuraea sp.]|nr:nitrate- and nitrite sensing domain-containing protein [Nonomuraea sp.]